MAVPLPVLSVLFVRLHSGGSRRLSSGKRKTRFVVLKIMDETTGRDITETGEAGSAVLYLFSAGGGTASAELL